MLITASNLHKTYSHGRIGALCGVDLSIESGDFLALMGPSGSGKSTLLQLIGALDTADSGQLSFNGKAYASVRKMAAFRARHVGFVFQRFHLFPTLTALENVQLPMLEVQPNRRLRMERARMLLDAMGLSERATHLPSELSGGEQQRVALARSLANEPELLLADEPTGSLDSKNADQIMKILSDLHREHTLTLLLVTHDVDVAAHAQRQLHMKDGRITQIN